MNLGARSRPSEEWGRRELFGDIGVKKRIDGEGGGGLRRCEHGQYRWWRAAGRSLGSCGNAPNGAVGRGYSVKVETSKRAQRRILDVAHYCLTAPSGEKTNNGQRDIEGREVARPRDAPGVLAHNVAAERVRSASRQAPRQFGDGAEKPVTGTPATVPPREQWKVSW